MDIPPAVVRGNHILQAIAIDIHEMRSVAVTGIRKPGVYLLEAAAGSLIHAPGTGVWIDDIGSPVAVIVHQM